MSYFFDVSDRLHLLAWIFVLRCRLSPTAMTVLNKLRYNHWQIKINDGQN